MGSQTLAPLELARQQRLSVTRHFDELESERDRYRERGLYKEAGEAQSRLENAKVEEEMRRLRALAEKHQMELSALEDANNLEYEKFVRDWERRRAELNSNISEQHNLLLLRHQEMQDQFEMLCSKEVVKPKWSRDLLNMRFQEEHLIKQRNFKVATKLKKAADALESKEFEAAKAAQQSRQAMEAAKLQVRCTREAEALQKKLQLSYDEHVLMQERELDKLMKRCTASRLALLRNQANKMILLEQALKGWFNPKKFGLSPPPLQAPPVILSPGAKLSMERPTRSAPGTPSPLDSPSADQMSRQGYKGSSMRSPSGGTSRLPQPNLQPQHKPSLMSKPSTPPVPEYPQALLPKLNQ
mmetsp:Transcript_6784/g.18213  ORF Transcript_6784/g.18213 Transcript_6784/m.18213 type:complete len:356 (+) Transcript_6784:119-1186(+)|eukprot:CAMPEP_0202349464 /NCGR_PEP_ID=MMETSP1126-20121109/6949_1 /ASSEMBLY_ACC=CAM_ASM_000457 /TAXON_ID=3047 /ORGANISM="Dunaliella tertiolecta, Strain CCMP1320" /LENGTH=355 /DNA_ID=CAMNT_0048941287 /DNA_START=215 /DNA_END=1282 /DNA_ORIENTATION=-